MMKDNNTVHDNSFEDNEHCDNCGHHHEHSHEENKLSIIIRVIVSVILTLISFFLIKNDTLKLIFYIIAFVIAAYDIYIHAVKKIFNKDFFDENFLMMIASLGAFLIGEEIEAIAVVVLYQIGEMLQDLAVDNSRHSIEKLLDIRPDTATLKKENGYIEVNPEEVPIGSIVYIKPGEKIPLDGVVVSGSSYVDTSALTGESVPLHVSEKSNVLAGCINLSKDLKVKTTKSYYDTTVTKILEIVENSDSSKARSERFITRFSKIYTPIVVLLAVIIALAVPVLTDHDWNRWLNSALSFLIISCPCSLVISIPLTFFSGIGGLSKKGILIKGAVHLENLSKADMIVFDKTGTLTDGTFSVTKIHAVGCTEEELLHFAAKAESGSNHPIAHAILERASQSVSSDPGYHLQEIAGEGIIAEVDENTIAIGNIKLMGRCSCTPENVESYGTIIHVAKNGQYMGYLIVSDTIKENSAETVSNIQNTYGKRCAMLTGDNLNVAQKVAASLGIKEIFANQLPDQKVSRVRELKKQLNNHKTLVFVGDGINDAPVLISADVGIAMGKMGSDIAVEAADIVLMDDDPTKTVTAIENAGKTMRICRENIIFSIGAKLSIMILSFLGITDLWLAVFADVGVCLITIANALRAFRVRK